MKKQLVTLIVVMALACALIPVGCKSSVPRALIIPPITSSIAITTTNTPSPQVTTSAQSQTSTTTPPAGSTIQPTITSATTPSTNAKSTGNKFSVNVENEGYSPITLNVSVGDTVLWYNVPNEDPANHTVTSDTGLFDVLLAPGETYQYTFTLSGTSNYHDKYNPASKGTIIVK